MFINFSFREKQVMEVPCSAGTMVKLYTVSDTYGSEGLYTATWLHDEIEPFPACLGAETTLLAHVNVQTGQDGQPTIGGYLHQEVTAHVTL